MSDPRSCAPSSGVSMRAVNTGDDNRRPASPPNDARCAPPVFVMNPHHSGLGIARSLAGRGIPVFALTWERDAPGVRSRYFAGLIDVPNGRDEPEALCKRLIEVGRSQAERPVIFPTRDFDVIFLHEHHDALAPYYRLPQRRESPIIRVMDKLELAQVARRLGIATPATETCNSPEQLDRLIDELRFPVVLKPRFAYQWRRQGVWTKVGAQKAIIAETPDALRMYYGRVAGATSEVLLQEYVSGADSEIVVCCCYVDRNGVLRGYFTGRKLRQEPPLVGTGSIVEATAIDATVAPSLALLRGFGYTGMAEVEFKYDRQSGSYFLIEINPRHWDQHELGLLAGVNLSWIAWQDIVGLTAETQLPVYGTTKYKWVAEDELLRNLLSRLRSEFATRTGAPTGLRLAALRRSLQEIFLLLQGRKLFSVWRLNDPLPGLTAIFRLARDIVRAAPNSMKKTKGA